MKHLSRFLPAALGILAVFSFVACSDDARAEASKKNSSAMSNSASVTVRDYAKDRSLAPATAQPKVVKTDAEWRKILSPEAFQVARGKGTERPFCGVFYDNHQVGTYDCACCGLPLFRSDAKFDSGTGWPSFFQPIAKENVTFIEDGSHGMKRTEILCTRCDGHLGHVFEDGPQIIEKHQSASRLDDQGGPTVITGSPSLFLGFTGSAGGPPAHCRSATFAAVKWRRRLASDPSVSTGGKMPPPLYLAALVRAGRPRFRYSIRQYGMNKM